MQCSKRLKPEREQIDLNAGAPTMRELVGGGLDVVAGTPNEGFDDGIGQAFALQGDKVTWPCGRCGHINDIKASTCAGCGHSFMESARFIADAEMPKKRFRSGMKALGIVTGGAVLMRLVAGLISPWAAAGLLAAAGVRVVVRFLRD
jgi:ribosomal protein L37E